MPLLGASCLGLLGLLAVVGFVAALVLWGNHQRKARLEAFARLAQSSGLTLYRPQHLGGAFGRGWLDVFLTTETRGSGKHRHTVSVTRYRVRHPAPLRMGLRVHAQSQFFGDIAEALGLVSDIRVGRADLDDAMRIGAMDATHAAAVLGTNEVTYALLSTRSLTRFHVDDAEAFAQHDGWVTDQARFEQWARPLASVVDALATSRAQHRAPFEQLLDDSWGRLAASEGFTYQPDRSALSLSTSSGTVEMFVGADQGKLVTMARVTVARPLGYGIEMYGTTAMGSLGKLLGAQDLTVGVPVLDDAYTIKASHEQGARSVLLGIAGDLTRLHEAFATLRVVDGGVEAKMNDLRADPIETTALLRALLRTCDGLAGVTSVEASAFR